MISRNDISQILEFGDKVIDIDGAKVGSIGQIYVDDQTGNPSWVTVNTGLFGSNESFAPLEGADLEGDDVRVLYSKAKIKDAPNVAPDAHLSKQEEAGLYRYYGLPTDDYTTGEYPTGTSGPTTDDSMTRSEEQLHVGTERREAGRARLRKFVITENVTKTVPVHREEVRVEREPVTDVNREEALAGPVLSEDEHEVVLHEERPVVEKQAVPVERVRLDKETVTEQQTVNEEVRNERIEVDDVDHGRR
ncbi:DUF2382 domain-containing protein [Arthrobacter zhaoguopingii]|uniref:DUF2382 domain-containing protein n=1 Tax=Arthrobacter zhaoguopingii TaxID=2681491 RepID=UPI00191562D3|nr:PRC and DUF2382 domain-containing protein [Arthrobacter zhaoguopingii]